jgi:hypothetical protein
MRESDLDFEVFAAIRDHMAARHQRGVEVGQIARERKGRLARGTLVTVVPESRREPAWFTCLLCREGARRFRVDLFAGPGRPLLRHVEAVRAHFADRHGVSALPAECIFDGRVSGGAALCVYLPATPRRGAAFICGRCPEGMNRILIGEPAFGDARRLAWLLLSRPGLHREVAGLDPAAQAIRLEAIDRGLVQVLQQSGLERAVRRARARPPACAPSEFELAVRVLLLARVGEGVTATAAITGLAALMRDDPTAYACSLGEAIPEMAPFLDLTAVLFAELVTELFGRLERSERTLWKIWAAIPEGQRLRAHERGQRSGQSTALQ